WRFEEPRMAISDRPGSVGTYGRNCRRSGSFCSFANAVRARAGGTRDSFRGSVWSRRGSPSAPSIASRVAALNLHQRLALRTCVADEAAGIIFRSFRLDLFVQSRLARATQLEKDFHSKPSF